MRFILTFSWKPNTVEREEALARFRKTGGQTPAGAKLIGRWTKADMSGGFDLIESNDVKALAEFAFNWSDLMELSIVPVVDDAELTEVFARNQPSAKAR